MDKNISKKKLGQFGIIIGIGIPLIIGYIFPLISGHVFRIWTLFIGIPLFIIGIIKPSFLLLPYKIWMEIGFILGWFNSRLILGIVYIIVLLPISLIMKCLGHDPLRNKKNNLNSYREIKKGYKIDINRIF